jgi:hypothetical protein
VSRLPYPEPDDCRCPQHLPDALLHDLVAECERLAAEEAQRPARQLTDPMQGQPTSGEDR